MPTNVLLTPYTDRSIVTFTNVLFTENILYAA